MHSQETLIERAFTAERPNQLYAPIWAGSLYRASVLDVFSRRVFEPGWKSLRFSLARYFSIACLSSPRISLSVRRFAISIGLSPFLVSERCKLNPRSRRMLTAVTFPSMMA